MLAIGTRHPPFLRSPTVFLPTHRVRETLLPGIAHLLNLATRSPQTLYTAASQSPLASIAPLLKVLFHRRRAPTPEGKCRPVINSSQLDLTPAEPFADYVALSLHSMLKDLAVSRGGWVLMIRANRSRTTAATGGEDHPAELHNQHLRNE